MTTYPMFAAVVADGNSATLLWPGGLGGIVADGNWGSGGTITLQVLNPVSTNYVATSTTLTADGIATFTLPRGVTLRLNLSSSTSPDLDAIIEGPGG